MLGDQLWLLVYGMLAIQPHHSASLVTVSEAAESTLSSLSLPAAQQKQCLLVQFVTVLHSKSGSINRP